jgi:CDP-glucose 4,6-dehydratase
MITSDKCYENVEWTWGYRENDRLGGKDPYSASKAAAEAAIYSMYHSYFRGRDDQRVISVRAGNVIGGGDWAANRIVPDAMRSWAGGQPVIIRSPKSTRPWQHVLEPLSGYLRAGQMLAEDARLSGESYNFGPRAEQSHTVLELLEALALGWDFDAVSQMVRVDKAEAFHEAGLLKLNCDKALHNLEWQPTMDFRETAQFTSDWYRRFYSDGGKRMREITLRQIETYVAYADSRGHAWTK